MDLEKTNSLLLSHICNSIKNFFKLKKRFKSCLKYYVYLVDALITKLIRVIFPLMASSNLYL